MASSYAANCERAPPTLPIIFLTARDSEFDAVSGLRLGADDYLTKDISLPHLMARVAALFRRLDAMQRPQGTESRITRGDLSIDTERMTIHWQDQPVGLTLTEFWLVHALARYPGHVKNRQQLMDAAQAVLDDNTITSHVKRIRRKFHAIDESFDSIETVYGMGYRWISELVNLRRQLLLVSLLTLMLPWAGCEFIRETEIALRARARADAG